MYIPHNWQKFQDLYTVFRLMENAFVELPHSWHDLVINHRVEEPPKLCLPSATKSLYKKIPTYFFGGDTMPLLQ